VAVCGFEVDTGVSAALVGDFSLDEEFVSGAPTDFCGFCCISVRLVVLLDSVANFLVDILCTSQMEWSVKIAKQQSVFI
jgi:hypothetical protein